MRTAIFGGSFNPVHSGHVNLVREICREVKLDRVIVMPTFISPFKKNSDVFVASAADRLNMCRLAFMDMPFVAVSDYETSAGGVSYTVNTIEHFHSVFPEDELFFIMGSDMLLSFKKWCRSNDILSLCTIIAASRQDGGADFAALSAAADSLDGRAILVKTTPFEASSTDIREKIMKNIDISCYVPKKVVKYIMDIGLYRK